MSNKKFCPKQKSQKKNGKNRKKEQVITEVNEKTAALQ